MIYLDDHIWDFDLKQALATIPSWRRDYALRYRQERDQRLSVAAYMLLQRALVTEYGIDEPPQFSFASSGKPRLALSCHPSRDIHFSLAHCSMAAACVVSDAPVGIDVESFDHYSEEVARRVMSEREMNSILTDRCPQAAFTRLWTMKESFYKLGACSVLDSDVPHLLERATDCHFTTIVHPSFIITCCS